MVVEFDYSRLGRVGSDQPSLIVSVNGREVPFDHGIDVTNGEFGALGICRDGRYVYQVYSAFPEGIPGQDEFYLVFDDGAWYCLIFFQEMGRLGTSLFLNDSDTGKWEQLPCPDQPG